MTHLLIVEDDQTLAGSMRSLFMDEGYAVDLAFDGNTGLQFALERSYDAAIVDIMLPEKDGFELIEQLRACNNRLPVLILSAMDQVDSRVKGLNTGADDYLVKPFSIAELKARVQALIRRAGDPVNKTEVQVNDLVLNYTTREVTRGGENIELQNREFELLAFLMENQGRIVSKQMIIKDVWHFNFDPQTNIVEARMSKLRDKVDRPFMVSLIQTIRGAGYTMGKK